MWSSKTQHLLLVRSRWARLTITKPTPIRLRLTLCRAEDRYQPFLQKASAYNASRRMDQKLLLQLRLHPHRHLSKAHASKMSSAKTFHRCYKPVCSRSSSSAPTGVIRVATTKQHWKQSVSASGNNRRRSLFAFTRSISKLPSTRR